VAALRQRRWVTWTATPAGAAAAALALARLGLWAATDWPPSTWAGEVGAALPGTVLGLVSWGRARAAAAAAAAESNTLHAD
jgi:hypothetical protein